MDSILETAGKKALLTAGISAHMKAARFHTSSATIDASTPAYKTRQNEVATAGGYTATGEYAFRRSEPGQGLAWHG